jgi:hypothetical protein
MTIRSQKSSSLSVFPENSGAVNLGSLAWSSVPFIRLSEGTIVHGLQLAFYFCQSWIQFPA